MTPNVTREMIWAGHAATMEKGDVILSWQLLERIYTAMHAASEIKQTCPSCEALARAVMMDQTGKA